MNRICLILSILTFLGASTAYGQDNGSTLRFDDQSWDFGTIVETDGKVSHRFEFSNTGTDPVVIESVSVSCGCTSISYSRAPVPPNEKGSIEVTYDPMNRIGTFLNKIVIKSGKGSNINIISITGTVNPRPRSVEEDYPFKAQQGIRFTTSSVNFDRVGQGQAKSMTIGYMNTSNKDVELSVVHAETHPWFRIISPGKICASCRGDIIITIDLADTVVWGMLTVPVGIYINGVKQNQELVVSALATDNFEAFADASGARSKLNAQFFHFGNVSDDIQSLSHDFTLENEGSMPLIIRAVQCEDGVATNLREGATVEPDGSVRFSVTIYPAPNDILEGRVIRSVKLIMNDPMRPIREIRLVANLIHR